MKLNLLVIISFISGFGSQVIAGVCKSGKHDADSLEYHEHGNFLFELNRREDSLPFYRTAVRICPEDSWFWWKLGLAEWELGFYEKAAKRFRFAESLETFNSSFSYPGDFEIIRPKETAPSSSKTFFPLFEMEKENFTFEDLGNDDFPFVVRNFWSIPDSGHPHSPSTFFDNLASHYSNHTVEFYPQNMREKPTRLYKKTLKETVQFLNCPDAAYPAVDISEMGAYIQWNVNFDDFQRLFSSFQNLVSGNNSENAFSPLRLKNDLVPFISSLLDPLPIKSKQKYLPYFPAEVFQNNPSIFVPDESDNRSQGSAGDEEDEDENEEEYEDDIVISSASGNSIIEGKAVPNIIDNILEIFNQQTHWYMILIGEEKGGMFHHVDNLPVSSWQVQVSGKKEWIICSPLSQDRNTDSYTSNGKDFLNPENENTCYKAILNPGDLLFYPKGFSHETISLSTLTVSISGTLVPLKDYRLLKTLIRKECHRSTIGYKFHQILCMLVNEKETL
jgi:tetratricopeptide (TPR) repeat protein